MGIKIEMKPVNEIFKKAIIDTKNGALFEIYRDFSYNKEKIVNFKKSGWDYDAAALREISKSFLQIADLLDAE